MGIPLWKEPSPPPSDPILSPANRLIGRRRTARPRDSRRARSSQTLFDLLRGEAAATHTNHPHPPGEGPPITERDRFSSQLWREINALPMPVPDPDRLSDSSTSSSARSAIWRRVRSPAPALRSSAVPALRASIARERDVQSPPPPTDREQQQREQREERESTPRLPHPYWDDRESDLIRANRFSMPFRVPRYLSGLSTSTSASDENDGPLPPSRRRENWYLAPPRRSAAEAGIDGLGDRERSISPDEAAQWELVASDIGLAACDLWDDDDTENGDAPMSELSLMWQMRETREEIERLRREEIESLRERERERERDGIERIAGRLRGLVARREERL